MTVLLRFIPKFADGPSVEIGFLALVGARNNVQVQAEKIVAVYEGIELEGTGNVKLTITGTRLIAEKKASRFSKKLATAMLVDFEKITGLTQDRESGIKVSHAIDSQILTEVLVADSKSQALSIMNQISERLQAGKKQQEEEAQRKKQAEMTDVLFTSYVLECMIDVWSSVSAIRGLLGAVRQGDWEGAELEVKVITKAVNDLIKNSKVKLPTDALPEALQKHSPEMLSGGVSDLLGRLGKMAGSKTPLSGKWSNYWRESNPNWSSVSYFLLFALSVNELLLNAELGKKREMEDCITRTKQMLPVIELKVGKDLVREVNGSLNNTLISEISQKISKALTGDLQKHLNAASA